MNSDSRISGSSNNNHFVVFRSDAFRRLSHEARGLIILVHEGTKPAADFVADTKSLSDVEALLRLLAISYEKTEFEEGHSSGTKFYISRSKFKAKRLARIDKILSKGWVDESGILSSEEGELYGIPACCVRAYLKRRMEENNSKSSVGPKDNPLQHPDEFRYLFYVPCSAGCLESKEIGWKIRQTLERLDPDTATRWRGGGVFAY